MFEIRTLNPEAYPSCANKTNNTMKRILSVIGGLVLSASASQAWVITPVWEFLVKDKINFTNSQACANLPFLTNIWNSTTVTNSRMLGDDPFPLLGKLVRYDANRMLLQIMENGIVENADLAVTNLGLYVLSTNFPDRSLIWINPTNGAPMGVALVIGTNPVPGRPTWVSNYVALNALNVNLGYSPNMPNMGSFPVALLHPAFMHPTNAAFFDACWYMDYDVSDDGYVYCGHRYKIFRYAPNGTGGFVTTPEVIFTIGVSTNALGQTNGFAAGNDRLKHRWFDVAGLFTSIKVRGAGINTRITAGGRGTYELGNYGDRDLWYLGPWVDSNGSTNWFPIAHSTRTASPGTSGGPHSAMLPALTNYTGGSNEMWCYLTEFPANNGLTTGPFCQTFTNANPYGYTNGLPTTDAYIQPNPRLNFGSGGLGTGNGYLGVNQSLLPYYRQQFIGGLECRAGVPFLVTWEAPTDRSVARGFSSSGYLGLHDLITGARLGVYDQGLNEADVILGVDPRMSFHGSFGEVTISAANGPDQAPDTWEVNYGSYCFGYGRYIVKNENIVITNIVANLTSGTAAIEFTVGNFSTNYDYVLQKTLSSVEVTNKVWTDVAPLALPIAPPAYAVPGVALTDSTVSLADTNAFYRIKSRVP